MTDSPTTDDAAQAFQTAMIRAAAVYEAFARQFVQITVDWLNDPRTLAAMQPLMGMGTRAGRPGKHPGKQGNRCTLSH